MIGAVNFIGHDIAKAYTNVCRAPFEKTLFLPVRNVTPSAVKMTPADGGHMFAKRHVNQMLR
jgi:hypothetical protein